MTRHVLTGIDGSPRSEGAAHWAAGEAHRRGEKAPTWSSSAATTATTPWAFGSVP